MSLRLRHNNQSNKPPIPMIKNEVTVLPKSSYVAPQFSSGPNTPFTRNAATMTIIAEIAIFWLLVILFIKTKSNMANAFHQIVLNPK